MMKKIHRLISVFLLIGLLSSLCMGCDQKDAETIYNETDFAFSYHMEEGQELKRGSTIHINVSWKNISQYPVALIGQDHGEVSATLFCKVEGAEYSFSRQEPALSSGAYLNFKIPTGQTVGTSCSFIIPMSAPSGEYHLRVSYKGGSETFYNVFTLSDMQDPLIPSGYKEQTNFGFGYKHIDGAFKRGQRIAIKTTVTNISNQPHTYVGSSGGFIADAELYCEIDGVKTVIYHEPVVLPEDHGTHVIASGQSHAYTHYFQIQEDAPSGSYHLRLNYNEEIVTFYNVFTLVSQMPPVLLDTSSNILEIGSGEFSEEKLKQAIAEYRDYYTNIVPVNGWDSAVSFKTNFEAVSCSVSRLSRVDDTDITVELNGYIDLYVRTNCSGTTVTVPIDWWYRDNAKNDTVWSYLVNVKDTGGNLHWYYFRVDYSQ